MLAGLELSALDFKWGEEEAAAVAFLKGATAAVIARCLSFEILRGRGCKVAAATALRLPLELGAIALALTEDKVAEADERVIAGPVAAAGTLALPETETGTESARGVGECDCNGGCEWWLHVAWRRLHWVHRFRSSRPLSIPCGLLLGGGLIGDNGDSRLIVDPSITTSRDGAAMAMGVTTTGPPTVLLVILLCRGSSSRLGTWQGK